jgi:hypothetical protein
VLFWKKRPEKLLKKIIVLQYDAHPHMANLMKAKLAAVGWEIMNYLLCSPDLASSNLYFLSNEDAPKRTEISN